MAEISELRARHRELIAKIAQLVAGFEAETGLRVRSATVVRDEHELVKLLTGGYTQADHNLMTYGPKGVHYVWIVPHAEV